MGLRNLVAQARARFLLDGVQGSVYRVDGEACELAVAAGGRFGQRSTTTKIFLGSGGNGGILVMSKVPIFRISKSKFLLFQEW